MTGAEWHVLRVVLCLPSLIALGGCDALLAPEIEDCEQFVLGKLRAPSTYERINARKTAMDSLTPPEMWVTIEYDAANAYGTPIRDTQICKYSMVNGHADVSAYIDHDAPSPEPDIVFVGRRKAIFVHGCFWHQHEADECLDGRKPKSNTAYWNAKLARNVERDRDHLDRLNADGWTTLVLWECETREQSALAKRLREFLT